MPHPTTHSNLRLGVSRGQRPLGDSPGQLEYSQAHTAVPDERTAMPGIKLHAA